MKAGLLQNLSPSRVVQLVPSTVALGANVATTCDMLESVPTGKLMLINWLACRQSSGGGSKNVIVYLAPEKLRNVPLTDPFLTQGGSGPDIERGLVPIGSSQQNASALQQGCPLVIPGPIVIPYGWMLKAVIIQTNGNATPNIIYLDYFWTWLNAACDFGW